MNKIILTLCVALALFLSRSAQSDPSDPIQKLISTPSSAFDEFLYRIYDSAKCYRGWFATETRESVRTPCMTGIDYSFSDNLVTMNFFVKPSEEAMGGYFDVSENIREALLLSVLQGVCQNVGVVPAHPELPDLYFGLIQTTPMRYGWATDEVDEKEIRSEIAKRTVINLRVTVRDTTYLAKRSQHGDVSFIRERVQE